MYKCLKRLSNAILENRFNESKYYTRKGYYGLDIAIMPLFSSYGQIGYKINVYQDENHLHSLSYDWELKNLTIDGMPYQDAINLIYLAEKDINKINDEVIWDNYPRSVEIECYTDAGGDIIIDLTEPTKEKLQEYINNFDINEEVLIWWQNGKSSSLPFDNIQQHYNDYKDWLEWLQKICNKMPY